MVAGETTSAWQPRPDNIIIPQKACLVNSPPLYSQTISSLSSLTKSVSRMPARQRGDAVPTRLPSSNSTVSVVVLARSGLLLRFPSDSAGGGAAVAGADSAPGSANCISVLPQAAKTCCPPRTMSAPIPIRKARNERKGFIGGMVSEIPQYGWPRWRPRAACPDAAVSILGVHMNRRWPLKLAAKIATPHSKITPPLSDTPL